MAIVYFDTNVYRHISVCGEAADLQRLLRAKSIDLVASSCNLIETFAISMGSERDRELRALTQLASKFEEQPQSWHQALELRAAIGRYRRPWLRTVAYEKRVHFFLRQHRAKWEAACSGEYPDPASYQQFRIDFERGIQHHNDFQRVLRREQLTGAPLDMRVDTPSGAHDATSFSLRDPEVFWRTECLLTWSEAILNKSSASRDLDDWLSPYVKAKAFETADYKTFWLREVQAADVPRNRLSGTAVVLPVGGQGQPRQLSGLAARLSCS